ncbi:MAG: hypothetical protein Ct9H300mP7_0030 [Verrucomicrobiota bacterium]|nr:MAG: hypothetical protein Ct9H300mP7_0030 [Verrucomicrobiota bacterium]
MYGMDSPNGVTAAYGHQALLARRLVERGVRFVELSCLPEKMGVGRPPIRGTNMGISRAVTKTCRCRSINPSVVCSGT